MGSVTGSKIQSGRSGATPRLGRLLLEGEVARGPASVVYAARAVEAGAGDAGAGGPRLAVKAYDPALRVLSPSGARFETATDPRLARVRRADETGDLPRDRLYRVTDLVRGSAASLGALGSLRATVAFFVEVARALAVAHARGAPHGHLRPEHALVLHDGRPLLTDPGVVLTPMAGRLHPESALLLAPEAIAELLADRPASATPEGDVYGLAASLLVALGGPAPGARAARSLERLLEAKQRPAAPVVAAAAVPRRAIDARALGALLSRALAPEADQRPRNAQAFADELAAVLEPPTKATEEHPPEAATGSREADAPRDQGERRAGGSVAGSQPSADGRIGSRDVPRDQGEPGTVAGSQPSADGRIGSRGAARSDAPRDQGERRAGGTTGGSAPREEMEDRE